MNILLVHNTYQQPGGEDVVFRNEYTLLRRFGHNVRVYERSNHEVDDYHGLGRLHLVKDVIWNSRSRKDFTRLLSDDRPDVVHVHNTFMAISPAIYASCREMEVPVVQTLHNYRLLCPATNFFRNGKPCEDCVAHTLASGVVHACYRSSRTATATVACMLKFHRVMGTWEKAITTYVALSDFSRQRFIAGGLPAQKIVVKPNFVDPDPGLGKCDGKFALFVGRLSPEKGLHCLLEAWSHLRRVPLVIVGGGPLLSELKAITQRHQLRNVVFCGRLTSYETAATIKSAAFLVQPSQCYENFPMTVAEAFASGTPVICSRIGALQEIVKDGESGLHFTPGNPEDLACKVDWAWRHRPVLRDMGRCARSEFENKYSADQSHAQLLAIYNDARKAFPAAEDQISDWAQQLPGCEVNVKG